MIHIPSPLILLSFLSFLYHWYKLILTALKPTSYSEITSFLITIPLLTLILVSNEPLVF